MIVQEIFFYRVRLGPHSQPGKNKAELKKMSEKSEDDERSMRFGAQNPTISNVDYPSTEASSFSSESDEENVYTRKEHLPLPAFVKKKSISKQKFDTAYYRKLTKFLTIAEIDRLVVHKNG